jgi:hypothetical protein
MVMTRLRLLPDGRYVERDGSGHLYLVTKHAGGSTVRPIERNGEVYIALGLRSDLDDRALYDPMDPSRATDPNVLVWDGQQGRYVIRGEVSAPGYGPGGVVIGPYHEPPLRTPASPSDEQQAPVPILEPGRAATGVQPAPAPEVPRPTVPISAVRPGLLQRIREWLRRVFG